MLQHRRVRPLLLLSLTTALACGDDLTAGDNGGTGTTSDTTAPTTGATTGPGPSTSSMSPSADSSGESGEETTTTDDTAGGEPMPEPLLWQTDCEAGGYDLAQLHPDLECTSLEVPLDWDAPDGEHIVVGAIRIPTTAEERVGTFWALDGGPGGSGLGYALDDGWREELRGAGWDIIIPPHRGTFSPLLTCFSPDYLSADCRLELEGEWGEGLQHFNTVQAARDVGEFIRRERFSEDEAVVVYGLSYGTYWAQFYAGEFPTQASAIILDSAVPTNADLALEEYLVQDVAEQLLQACVDDPVCGARVGFKSGAAFSAAVLSAFDDGECGAGDNGNWEDSNLRQLFGQLINRRNLRNYVPLLAAMLTRCDPELSSTVGNAINGLFGQLGAPLRPTERLPIGPALVPGTGPLHGGTPPPPNSLFSGPLQSTVLATTMLTADATPVQAELDARRHLASLGFSTLMRRVQEGWNELPKVEFDRDFESQTPMLVFNAHYDLQTVFPWAEIVAAQHGAQLIEFSDGQHGVTLSNTGGKTLEGESCARELMLAFVEDPGAPVDDGCAGELPQLDVNLVRPDLAGASMAAFGTDDPWSLLPSIE
ncbi:MAG: alpha/beta fold hydrolase [Nannocystaceae bacterium]|nr:alpha/beta fold hydrolase [Nannocystaceae bacterium]